MKQPERPLDSKHTGSPVAAPEFGESPEWRQIPIAEPTAQRLETEIARPARPERRIDTRLERSVAASFTTIDPVRDSASGALFYDTSEEEVVLNVSRRGLCLRCERPPAVGTRLLIEMRLPSESDRADMIGRVCWTRVEYTPGAHGARAVALVGIELLGGSAAALDSYDRSLGRLLQNAKAAVATQEAVG